MEEECTLYFINLFDQLTFFQKLKSLIHLFVFLGYIIYKMKSCVTLGCKKQINKKQNFKLKWIFLAGRDDISFILMFVSTNNKNFNKCFPNVTSFYSHSDSASLWTLMYTLYLFLSLPQIRLFIRSSYMRL